MTNQVIPAEAVEAAARVIRPAAWGPQVWTFQTPGETPTEARNRVQQEALKQARAALEAAAPYMQAPAASDLEDQDDLVEILKKERWKYVAMKDEDGRPDGGYFEQSNDDVARAIVRAGFRKMAQVIPAPTRPKPSGN